MSSPADGGGIESSAPPAVKNLRSKFEQLSLPEPSPPHLHPHPHPHRLSYQPITGSNSGAGSFLHPDSSGARPRAVSNPREPSETEPGPGQHHQHLRTASSSSDLKRKPPPPPVPKRLSPAGSPLLRPVAPGASSVSSGYASDVSASASSGGRQIPMLDLDDEGDGRASSVADLVNKFASSSPSPLSDAPAISPSRRQRSPLPFQTSTSTSTSNPPPPAAAPVIPPRAKPTPPPRPPPRRSLPLDDHHQYPHPPPPPRRLVSPSAFPHSNHHHHDSSDSAETIFASSPDSHVAPPSRHSSYHSSYSSAESSSASSLRLAHSSHTSLPSTADDASSYASHPPPPPSLSRPVPPRPPPRHGSKPSSSSTTSGSSESLTLGANAFATSGVTHLPPPLPSRRPTAPPEEALTTSPVTSPEKRSSAAQRLPPPPTRTIAPGDKLPPARRVTNDDASSDESEAEPPPDDPKARLAESMPDSSRASRRPPRIHAHRFSEREVVVPAHQGGLLCAGSVFLVATHHHVRVYDLDQAETCAWALDARVMGLPKELRVTAMEWRVGVEKGRYAWLGTKEGHIFEIDVSKAVVTGQRLLAHAGCVTHILRYGRAMVSLDEFGKTLIFDPAPSSSSSDTADAEPVLAHTQPRVARIAEHQGFARIFGGRLWTSAREPAGSSRGPVIRVYDIFTPGSVGRSVLPTEHMGAITSGTVVPSDPTHVYLGHEGGVVSIWTTGADDGSLPACIETVKVGVSDILAMEGVNDRLWIGGRKGTISAYDVVPRPWVLRSGWTAHGGLPVTRLAVDVVGMEKAGRCVVVSVGRDERVGVWDGMLGLDWVEAELLRQETHFSTFRDLTVLISTWNIDAARPEHLIGTPANVNLLTDVLRSVDSPDIVAFGFQEMIDLESRKMAAKTMLLGNGGGSGGGGGGGGGGASGGVSAKVEGEISEKVTRAYRRWYDRLVNAVRLAMPPECPYTVIHTENLVGLFTCIFVKNSERVNLRDVAVTTVKRGMGGRYGNKGAIVARLVVDDSSVCFINCHLAAGQRHVRQRNADVASILEENAVFEESEPVAQDSVAYVGGGDGSMVLDHEIVFMNGDMNYRIDQRREIVINASYAGEHQSLLVHDQLLKEMKFNRGFRLRTFREGPLTFAPTYKYDRRTDEYDSSEKRRTPAWCDRVLWRSREEERVELLSYRRYEANVSDHRPVSAAFRMRVKSVRMDQRAEMKREVEAAWKALEREKVRGLLGFYARQRLI